jgi:NADH-quinone oxidoreductase subunit L
LGFLAVVGGIFMKPLEGWLEPVFASVKKSLEVAEHAGVVQGLAITAGIGGIIVAAWAYYLQGGAPAKNLAARMPGLHKLLLDKWRVDELYDELFIGTVDFVADVFVWVDENIVDGIIAKLSSLLVAAAGTGLRLLQTGRLQTYAAFMVLGTATFGWFFTMPQARAHVDRDDTSGHYVVTAAPGLGYEYRWDADADGKPDAEDFSDKKSVELTLGVGETRDVRLEVRNAFGRVGQEVVTLTRPKPEEPKSTAALAPPGDETARVVVALGQGVSP